jgi:hypothetical protein
MNVPILGVYTVISMERSDDEPGKAVDGSHYVRSFGSEALAEFEEDGSPLGGTFLTAARPFTYVGDDGEFENGAFFGLAEFSEDLGDEVRARLARGTRIVLRRDPAAPGMPVDILLAQPVMPVRGNADRWLFIEVTQ